MKFTKALLVSLLLTVLLGAQSWAVGTIEWRSEPIDQHASTTAIGPDKTLYVLSSSGMLYAIDSNGTTKWSLTLGEYVNTYGAPTVSRDSTIYVGDISGYLYSVKPNGTLKWSVDCGGMIDTPSIASDGTVYVHVGKPRSEELVGLETLKAISPEGRIKWTAPLDYHNASATRSPVIGRDGTIYLVASSSVNDWTSTLYAFQPDGTQKWAVPAGRWGPPTPALGADGTIYVLSGDANYYAFRPDGSLKWSVFTGYTGDHEINASPVIGDNDVSYVVAEDRILSLNNDGTERWYFKNGAGFNNTPAISEDGTIYVTVRATYESTLNDSLYGLDSLFALNPDGTVRWEIPNIKVYSDITLDNNGRIYLIDASQGKLLAINTHGLGLANSAWPKYKGDLQNTGNISSNVTEPPPANPPSAPVLSYTTNGLNLSITWSTVPDATGYTLYYAPYPYTGPETIESMGMGNSTSFNIDLWEGAAYYIAVTTENDAGESGYSNIEYFIIP